MKPGSPPPIVPRLFSPWATGASSTISLGPSNTTLGMGYAIGQGDGVISNSRPPGLEADQARFRLFDSINTCLKNAAQALTLCWGREQPAWYRA